MSGNSQTNNYNVYVIILWCRNVLGTKYRYMIMRDYIWQREIAAMLFVI